MIEIKDIIFSYNGSSPVLDDVTLEFRDGEYVAIIGPNGCGKTTLIKFLNALLVPAEGSVKVDGFDTRDRSNLGEIRRRVGMVFQNPDSQIVGMTVEEDVAFGPENLGLPPDGIKERVRSSLSSVGISDLACRQPHILSGGEKRLVAIAGVLAMEPRYIAFDEPTSYLDPDGRTAVLAMISKLSSQGIGIIHISHDMDDVVGADRVVVLRQGRVEMDDTPTHVFTDVKRLREMGLKPPRATELLDRLRTLGLVLPCRALTIEDACWEILSLAEPKNGMSDKTNKTGGSEQ